jgi:hypothetical protein
LDQESEAVHKRVTDDLNMKQAVDRYQMKRWEMHTSSLMKNVAELSNIGK